jgi:YidC/Oxa1 family membrane protein insertase
VIDTILDAFQTALTLLHDLFEPLTGVHSWGWSIIALTLIVRVALLPLAIKQTRSMRAMQALQPQMKELQKKYKVDRSLMKKDPETYKAKKAKLNEEMMALYQREGANPAASCLPLLAQAPIFIALFYTLRRSSELDGQPFYFITSFTSVEPGAPDGLSAAVSAAGWPGWLLIVLMSGSMFLMQKQMMARNSAQMADNPMAQQQKILLYVMPVFLAVISFQFPLGILLYWVTTNLWQVVQQAIILREVKQEAAAGELEDKPGGDVGADKPQPKRRTSGSATSGSQKKPEVPPTSNEPDTVADADPSPEDAGVTDPPEKQNGHRRDPRTQPAGAAQRDHLPRRGGSARS